MRFSSCWYLVLLSLLAAVSLGCTASEDASAAVAAPPGISGPHATLAFDLDGTLTLAPGEMRRVQVTGSPAAHYLVSFFLLGNALDASVDHTTVVADDLGRASVELRAPNSATTFRLRAAIQDGPSAEAAVAVSDQGFGSIRVVPVYAGQRPVGEWIASVVARSWCADVVKQLPADPDGAILAAAVPGDDLVIEDAPVGPNLAVALRAGHYIWGCADSADLVAGGTSVVNVPVVDKLIDLAETDLGVTLAWSPDPAPYQQILGSAADELAEAVFPAGAWPWTTLLDAMEGTLSEEAVTDFAAARQSHDWDSLVGAQLEAAGVDPRASIAAWALSGRAGEIPAIEGRLTSIGDAPGEALLEVQSFAGVPPEAAGVPAAHVVSWTADATDTVLLHGTLFWMPARYAAALAQVGAALDVAGAASVPEALAGALCGGISATIGVLPTCDDACVEAACDDALAALWAKGLGAGASFGEVAVTAGGPAHVGDTASPVSFDGAWVGAVEAGPLEAQVTGVATGAPYSNPPP